MQVEDWRPFAGVSALAELACGGLETQTAGPGAPGSPALWVAEGQTRIYSGPVDQKRGRVTFLNREPVTSIVVSLAVHFLECFSLHSQLHLRNSLKTFVSI
jgi:hypothetical protein